MRQVAYGRRLRSAFVIPTAAISSIAQMPSPTASGRYGDVNGTSSWPSEIGTTRSSSSEPPCSTMKTPVRIARKRCTSSTANFGQREASSCRPSARRAAPTRRAAGTRRSPPSGRSTKRRGSCRDLSRERVPTRLSLSVTAPSCATNRPARLALVEPRRPGGAEEQGGLRGDVGDEAASRGDGDVAPRAVDRACRCAGRSDGSAARRPRASGAWRRSRWRARRRGARCCRRREPDDDRFERSDVAAGGHPPASRRARARRRSSCPSRRRSGRAARSRCGAARRRAARSNATKEPPPGTTAPTSGGSRAKSRSYPAATIAPPTAGVTSPSVARAASSERESIDANSPETSVSPRGKALTRESSEEGRNLLKRASRSSKSARTSPTGTPYGSATSQPMARKAFTTPPTGPAAARCRRGRCWSTTRSRLAEEVVESS